MRKYSFYLGIFSLCLLVLSGCGKLDRKGTRSTNATPEVYFANMPPESTYFSVNPKVHWFGTDIDGFITAYQYAVMVTDSVVSRGGLDEVKSELHQISPDSASWVNETTLMKVIGVHLQAEPGGHSRNIKMFADMDPEIYTPQYVFVRAIDNRGATSEVISRMFYRNNHRPQAFFDMDSASLAAFTAKGHYCLEETTVTWKGISISWSGLDIEDYPNERDQPEFDFKWELLGPFDSLPGLNVDTTAVEDSSLDSVSIAGQWVYSRWVSESMHVFKGLENYGDSGYGWYQLRVRARDDAFVSTDTATTLNFRILKPKFLYDKNDPEGKDWRKTILVVDATLYGGKKGGAAAPAHVRPFYQDALTFLKDQQPPLCDESEIWYDPAKEPGQDPKDAPGEDVLSRYDLTIVLNLGSDPGITEDNFKRYKEYLNVGGCLWLIGLNNFRLGRGRDKLHSLEEELRGSYPNTYEVGTQYCGIEEVFDPTWTILDSMTLEFIRAEPFGLWEDTLKVDSVKCRDLTGYDSTLPAQNFGARGIPRVCFVTMSNYLDFAYRTPAQRRIFTFISYYRLPPMHGMPCAVSYIGPTYRTAEFCFPLNLMKNDEQDDYPVFKVMGKMVKWFLPEE